MNMVTTSHLLPFPDVSKAPGYSAGPKCPPEPLYREGVRILAVVIAIILMLWLGVGLGTGFYYFSAAPPLLALVALIAVVVGLSHYGAKLLPAERQYEEEYKAWEEHQAQLHSLASDYLAELNQNLPTAFCCEQVYLGKHSSEITVWVALENCYTNPEIRSSFYPITLQDPRMKEGGRGYALRRSRAVVKGVVYIPGAIWRRDERRNGFWLDTRGDIFISVDQEI